MAPLSATLLTDAISVVLVLMFPVLVLMFPVLVLMLVALSPIFTVLVLTTLFNDLVSSSSCDKSLLIAITSASSPLTPAPIP